jgi:predicted  nucleic acid-binding Zn-ribbon protein
MWRARKQSSDADSEAAGAGGLTTASPPVPKFDRVLIAAVLDAVRSCAAALSTQRAVERESVAVSAVAERLHDVQRRAHELERRLEDELETIRVRGEGTDGVSFERLVEGMRNEMRERIGFLLDEQRVCLRQLSSQTAEEAARVDRVRRTAEVRLQEAARRLEELAGTAND